MVDRKRHPSKEIEAALCYAEFHGWLVVAKGHHAWGKMYTARQICRRAAVVNTV